MKNFKYKTTFSSNIRCLVPEENDKFLSKASAEKLKDLVPNSVKGDKNIDLLPFASALANIGRANKNGHLIAKDTAISIYKQFINRPINLGHSRDKVVGVIVNAGFSEFGSDNPLLEDDLKDLDIFNISISAVIYKVISDKLVDFLIESSDPSSELYGESKLSWELMYNNYNIMVGSKNITDSKILDKLEDIEKYSPYLLSNNGSGKDLDGNLVSMLIVGDVYPVGAAITSNPAAELSQLYVVNGDGVSTEILESSATTSQSAISPVINSEEKNNLENMEKTVKITKIEDLTNESLKLCEASNVMELINSELEKANEQWKVQISAKDAETKDLNEKYSTAAQKAEKAEKDLADLTKKFEDLNNKVVAQEKESKFNARMSYFDEKYELSDEDRKIIASDLSEVSEESYDKYQAKMDILLKSKDKVVLASVLAEKEKEIAALKVSTASVMTKEEVSTKVEDAISDGTQTTPVVPNTATIQETLYDKWKNAFSAEVVKRK